ncbi:MAG: CBS domain-containing protein [Pelotomaculum sp.]
MDIITTHTNADLDALASLVAAQKLYPGATMVFSGTLSKNVEEFMALHKDAFNIKKAIREIPMEQVSRVVLVDTKKPSRLGKIASLLNKPGVEVHIYDHHPRSESDARGDFEQIDMVGATTTILVEKIKEQNLPVSPLEATLLALGIYEDTGSLLFTSTTPRDAQAVAFTLAKGANLSVVADFLWRPLTEEQIDLLKTLLADSKEYEINGARFIIATAERNKYVGGLDVLTHKLAEFSNPDAVFTVVGMGKHVQVVARSSVPEISVKEILSELGGGGHPAAASANIKNSKVTGMLNLLMEAIRQNIKSVAQVAQIMTSPVKTVMLETPVEEAGRLMLRYGHTGLPVVKDSEVVGVISRRDVEKATHHGLGHAPVKGFMSGKLVSVAPETTVARARELMIEHDIGRLPVLQAGKLVGIISRTDVLRTLHGAMPSNYRRIYSEKGSIYTYNNIRELLYRSLPQSYITIMEQCRDIAQELGYKVYIAGGMVRDLLLGVQSFDIDLVVEGNGMTFGSELARRFDARARLHPKFKTANVIFQDGRQVDVATARLEFYQYPAALPQVETSSLHQDLYRRDFTINAMAVSLNQENFGDIVDYFNGRGDLEYGLVRVLHNLSFVEDPTRLLRGVRLEKRYDFIFETQTFSLVKDAVQNKMLERASMERVWEELKHILNEPRPGKALGRLEEIGLWDYLFPGVLYGQVRDVVDEIPRFLRLIHSWSLVEEPEQWLVYLLALLHRSGPETAVAICQRYHLSRRWSSKVEAGVAGWQEAVEVLRLGEKVRMSQLADKVLPLPNEIYPVILAQLNSSSIARFRSLLNAIQYERPCVNGNDIKSMGYKPGPYFAPALEALQRARLDGLVRNRQEELDFVREYLAAYEGAKESV